MGLPLANAGTGPPMIIRPVATVTALVLKLFMYIPLRRNGPGQRPPSGKITS